MMCLHCRRHLATSGSASWHRVYQRFRSSGAQTFLTDQNSFLGKSRGVRRQMAGPLEDESLDVRTAFILVAGFIA